MKGKYRATFVIPLDTRRVLEDAGWEFFSLNRIPQDVVGVLMEELALVKIGAYLGMEEFSGDDAKATVLLDEQGQVENIYLRAYGDRNIHDELLRVLALLKDQAAVEVFSPEPAQRGCQKFCVRGIP